MSTAAIASRAAINRANGANRRNSRHSTGPRTDSGKQRSSQNALRHGLTAASAVLPSEDQAAYDAHRRGFFDEYKPATPTETQLVIELADTAWRLNCIPLLEAALLSQDPNPQTLIPQLATLGLHYQRLSRQFQKAVDHLREIQADRAERERRDLRDAAASSNSTNTKEFRGSPPIMASFFPKTKWSASRNAPCASTKPATSSMCASTCLRHQ
jgi:hypothetical protein